MFFLIALVQASIQSSSNITTSNNSTQAYNSTQVWHSCPHTSKISYFNATFHPYPLSRNTRFTINPNQPYFIEALTPSSYIEISITKSWLSIPLLKKSVDVCDFIVKKYGSNYTCPLNEFKTTAVLMSLLSSDDEDTPPITDMFPPVKLPWYVLPGDYECTVKFIQLDNVVTCAKTTIHII